jgi:hypothetical protein
LTNQWFFVILHQSSKKGLRGLLNQRIAEAITPAGEDDKGVILFTASSSFRTAEVDLDTRKGLARKLAKNSNGPDGPKALPTLDFLKFLRRASLR